jgi:hypothetical protein
VKTDHAVTSGEKLRPWRSVSRSQCAAEHLFLIGKNGRLGTFSAGVIGWLIKEDQDIFSAQKKGSPTGELPGSS